MMKNKYMIRGLSGIALLALFAGTLAAQEISRRPMTADDMLEMVRVDEAVMSPDGEWVLYRKSELDWKKNKRRKTYHLVPSVGGSSYQYLNEEGTESPKFSPDGQWLAFTRKVEKVAQLFVIRTAGGEARQLTKHKSAVESFQWLSGSRTLLFVADEALSGEEKKERENGEDAIFVEEGPNSQRRAEWQNFWKIGLEDGKERQVTSEKFRVGDFDVSPDGSRIAFTARYENRRNQGNLSEIFLLDLDTGHPSGWLPGRRTAAGSRTRLTTIRNGTSGTERSGFWTRKTRAIEW